MDMDRQQHPRTIEDGSSAALAADSAPGAEVSPHGRLRLRLSREGILYLVILVVLFASALVNEINLLVLLFGLMAGPFLFSGLLAWNALRGLEVRRRWPEHAEAGEPFFVTLEAQHRKLLGGAWSTTVEDHLEALGADGRTIERHAPKVWFLHLPAGRITRGSYRGRITQRGVYRFGALKTSTRFPLGLIELSRTFDQPGELIVYPRSGRLTKRWGQQARSATSGQGHRPARSAAGDNDYHGLRDFRPGDNPRWIHWRTSARHGRLMVREFEQHRRQDVTVVLDLWAPPDPTEDQLDLVELAISVTATICTDACRAGRHRIVVVLGAESIQVLQGRTSPALTHQILRELARARPRSEGDLWHVLQRARTSQPRALSDLVQTWQDARRGILIVSTRPAEGPAARVARADDLYRNSGPNGLARRSYLDVGSPELSEFYQCR
jgi:uncharacterized protein (DUF58 family)